MIEDHFKNFFHNLLLNIRNFSNENFANNMNKRGLHFESSNLDEYHSDRDKHADKRDSGKDKCVCSIDILPAIEMSGNAHEDLKISFEDSYDEYDNSSVNFDATGYSSKDKNNVSLSKLQYIKLKNIKRVIITRLILILCEISLIS